MVDSALDRYFSSWLRHSILTRLVMSRYRGLMVDAARHFMPKAVLQRTIDAMSAAKVTVLRYNL